MRKIRFRAYDKVDKAMKYFSCGIFNRVPDGVEDLSELMQFTGLYDKNGTEIYDGDLLTDMVGDVFEVFYNTAHCAYMAKYVRTKHAEKKRGYFRLGDQCSLTIEVIGNIWENLELLKQF